MRLMNANLASWYRTGFANWALQITSGKSQDNSNPPKPPLGYTTETDIDGWTYVVIGTEPVCAIPSIPTVPASTSDPKPPNPDTGEVGSKMNVPVGDIYPEGHIIVIGSGIWQKKSDPTPFGEATFYERIQ